MGVAPAQRHFGSITDMLRCVKIRFSQAETDNIMSLALEIIGQIRHPEGGRFLYTLQAF